MRSVRQVAPLAARSAGMPSAMASSSLISTPSMRGACRRLTLGFASPGALLATTQAPRICGALAWMAASCSGSAGLNSGGGV
jgi:hypothetical protein